MLEPQPAATVMVARDNGACIEVYLVRRSARSAFMPDVFVFPGGRVDAPDAGDDAMARMRGATRGVEPGYVFAAARETFEEAGMLFAAGVVEPDRLTAARKQMLTGARSFIQILDDLGTRVDAGEFRYFSRWITPPGESRRFDTHFFVARAPAGQIARADALETHDGVWLPPAQALAQHAAGSFALILPTIKHLERLCAFATVDELLAYAENKPIRAVMPDAGRDAEFFVPAALEGVW